MLTRYVVISICLGAWTAAGPSAVYAQTYPSKPIRITTAEPGGGADFTSRLIAQGNSGNLAQPMIVDNRASSVVPDLVSKAPADGYTLLVSGNSLWIAPLLRDNVSYDVVRDFAPITLAAGAPNILVVHPSLPVTSVKELIALAKAHPGQLNYGSGPIGTTNHLSAELFKAMAGVNIVRVNYKGAGQVTNDLIAGQIQVMFPSVASVTAHLKTGRLRALAVTSAQPSALAPGLPTITGAGVPGYESVSIYGVFAPAKTPGNIINRLNQEIGNIINRADVKEKFIGAGIEVVASSPEGLSATVKSEIAKLGKVIKSAGIRAE